MFQWTLVRQLPCTEGLIWLKLSSKGHVYFEPVSRTKLLNAPIYLKAIPFIMISPLIYQKYPVTLWYSLKGPLNLKSTVLQQNQRTKISKKLVVLWIIIGIHPASHLLWTIHFLILVQVKTMKQWINEWINEIMNFTWWKLWRISISFSISKFG